MTNATDDLTTVAEQAGVDGADAARALQIGARLLAHGFTDSDVDGAVKNYHRGFDELGIMLRTFHDSFGVERSHYIDATDIDPDVLLRIQMLHEELGELMEAVRHGDITAVADAYADIIYIAAGGNDLLGIPTMRVLRAVQAANMRKLGPDGKPVPHPTIPGKIGKPEGWTGPEADIERILIEEGLL